MLVILPLALAKTSFGGTQDSSMQEKPCLIPFLFSHNQSKGDFSFWPLLHVAHQNSQMCLGGDRSSLLTISFNSSELHNGSWDLFPPPAVSSPLPPKPHPTTLCSYLKCQRLLPITPPHAKPEARATQTEASPLRLLSVCFHISLPSVSPPPWCSYCFSLSQGLLCFSSS